MNKIGSDKELLVYLQKSHGGKSMTIGRAVRHILTFNWVFIYYEAMLLIGYLNQDCISTLEVPYGLKFRIHQIIKFVLLTFWIRTKRSHWQGKGISGMHFSWCHLGFRCDFGAWSTHLFPLSGISPLRGLKRNYLT